ncbi:MAG: glutathione S-transferase N-terminal domain-containing protein [Myxococcota bacterium]
MSSESSSAPQDHQGNRLDLVLFKYDSCPYCRFVMQAIEQLHIPVTYKDTRRDPQAAAELLRVGGKSQVPCLLINGEPLYESHDIVQFLQNEVRLSH